MNQDLMHAHRFSSWNRQQLLAGERCACFYCLARFTADTITDWTDDEQTAVCPNCQVDSVLSSASGVKLDQAFLQRMHDYWFD